jgi:hypothetical protein
MDPLIDEERKTILMKRNAEAKLPLNETEANRLTETLLKLKDPVDLEKLGKFLGFSIHRLPQLFLFIKNDPRFEIRFIEGVNFVSLKRDYKEVKQ